MPHLHLTLAASLDDVPAAGGAVRQLCLQAGVDAHDAALVELAIVEALQNTIEHGYAGQPGHLELDARIDDDQIRVVLRDTAPAIDLQRVTSAQAGDDDPADRTSLRERGRGLEIIRGVFDEVTFSRADDRNHLALIRARQRDTA